VKKTKLYYPETADYVIEIYYSDDLRHTTFGKTIKQAKSFFAEVDSLYVELGHKFLYYEIYKRTKKQILVGEKVEVIYNLCKRSEKLFI
jgi:hypothetical protein